ncbi:unknown [Prevotella sp. CAG:755]|nr:unknown [Prevotella sp. CAG:755]
MAEHLSDIEVERSDAIALFESEMGISRRFADHIHRRPLALGNAPHMVEMLFLDKEPHALLALVSYYFLGRKRLVANGELRHVDQSAAVLHQLREAVDMSGRPVVMDAHHWVHVFLTKGTHKIVGTFLHLGIGTLHSVQLDAARITAGID